MSPSASRIGPIGWLRVGRRAIAGLGLLSACLALYPFGALRRRNPVPPMFLSGMLRIVGGRLSVVGEKPHAPAILLANHVSWMDILALAGASGSAFVAHDGLAGHRVMRFLCRLNRTVFIARHDRGSIDDQIAQVEEGLKESGVLTLFPEGTTGDGRNLMAFKSALLAVVERNGRQASIQPVWIDYGADAAIIAWHDAESGLSNVKRILARRKPIDVTVHLLPPLSERHRHNRKVIAAAAHDAIASRMA